MREDFFVVKQLGKNGKFELIARTPYKLLKVTSRSDTHLVSCPSAA